MSKEYIATANSVEEATALALAELNVNSDEAEITVLEEPGKKLFGGRKDAVVKVVVISSDTNTNETTLNERVCDELATECGVDASTAEQNSKTSIIVDVEEPGDLSDEQIDAIADAGIEHLKKIISFLDDQEVSIEEFEGDEGEIILDVSGEDAGVLIGRHGRTIDALQSVVSAMTTRKMGIRYPLSVDVEGYKHRRKQKVVDIAKHAATRAINTNKPISLKAMTPYERRVVHMALRNHDGVISTSEGIGSYRHVVIIPK